MPPTASSGGARDEGSARYPIPAAVHRVEEEIRRSRFITTLAPAPDEPAAHDFVAAIRSEFPDATHHCWAFVAGPPGSTRRVGMSDDGEPQGTAGRPMLNVLLHAGIGEVAAVVTRFYGGVKLGKGGLGRAYAGGVREALATLPRSERVSRVALRIRVAYGANDPLRRLLEALEAKVVNDEFGTEVVVDVAVPEANVEELVRRLADLTSGLGEISPLPAPRPRGDGD
ncbi:MAG: YigZ family protein [Gemmatimonadales bacterium]|nr:MAG: YigZ family protein [Gemmatimonadales bacterium]